MRSACSGLSPHAQERRQRYVWSMRHLAITFFRLLVFVAGARLSSMVLPFNRPGPPSPSGLSEYLVGLIFGLVILAWHSGSIKQAVSRNSIGFLAASTLIWVFVLNVPIPVPNDQYGVGLLVAKVALGTVLLPIAHAGILGESWRRVVLAIPAIYGLWWYLTFNLTAMQWMVESWQGAYLLFMFGSIPGSVWVGRRRDTDPEKDAPPMPVTPDSVRTS